jgi:predicted porin
MNSKPITALKYIVTARKSNTPYSVLSHNGYVTNAMEIGAKFGGFSAIMQGSTNKTNGMDVAGLLGLQYNAENFTVFASAVYTDLTNEIQINTHKDGIHGTRTRNDLSNWKIGAQGRFAGLKIGLQYEKAQMGTMTGGEGQYIMGSAEYIMGNISLATWVGHYEDKNLDNENALSFAVGAKYKFSKRTGVHLGYRQANSENDFRDENMFVLGIRHAF